MSPLRASNFLEDLPIDKLISRTYLTDLKKAGGSKLNSLPNSLFRFSFVICVPVNNAIYDYLSLKHCTYL